MAEALDKIFVLHADHEQNASTSTVRIAGSSGANHSPVSLPVSPACGDLPMAARTTALQMLAEIGSRQNSEFIAR